MKKLIKQFVFFSIIPSLLIIHNFLTDPFDYFDSGLRLPYNRMEKMRKLNTATWTLAEIRKIDPKKKQQARILFLGDSRGQAILTKGFRGGWKKRTFLLNQIPCFDMSFGAAMPEESFSLLEQELINSPKAKTVYFIVSQDRFITGIPNGNRIKTNSLHASRPYPTISYLTDLNNIKFFWQGIDDQIQADMNQTEIEGFKKQIASDFIGKYPKGSREKFDVAWNQFVKRANGIAKKHGLRFIIVIPPYEPVLMEGALKAHTDLIAYAHQKMANSGMTFINLQEKTKYFHFIDAVHGLYTGTDLFNDLLNSNNEFYHTND